MTETIAAAPHPGPAAHLPRALRLAALASWCLGWACLSLSTGLAETLGLPAPRAIQGFGMVLLAHCALLLWASGRAQIGYWARRNVLGLAIFAAVLVGLAVVHVPTGLGRGIALAVAALVGGLARWHWRLLTARTDPEPPR